MGLQEELGEQRAYGATLARRFGLDTPKYHVARARNRGPLAVTQIKSNVPTAEPTKSIGYDDAYLVALQIEAVRDHELWQDGRPVKVETFEALATSFYDLRRDPIAFVRQPYHSLQFYIPRSAIFGGELTCRFGVGFNDPVLRHLGAALLPAFERNEAVDGLFLDHVLQAAAAHILARYGEIRPAKPARGGLAAWQERRVKEIMRANVGMDVSLKQLADEIGLSVAHFARAFRQSAKTSPHRWLNERRIEKSIDLLAGTELSLADIATACGFADQSHFTRAFTKQTGISPGRWRRGNARKN